MDAMERTRARTTCEKKVIFQNVCDMRVFGELDLGSKRDPMFTLEIDNNIHFQSFSWLDSRKLGLRV